MDVKCVMVLAGDLPAELAVNAAAGLEGVTVVGFSDVAQRARTYEEYVVTLAGTPSEALSHLGVALCGPKKGLNKLVGNLALYGRAASI